MGNKFSKKKTSRPPREEKTTLLIVTEGTQTEPNYFRAMIADFRLPTVKVHVEGTGRSTKSLVEWAITKKDQDGYDELWCVFDKDDFPDDKFNAAIAVEDENKGIKICFSNESFELWYVLHFCNHSTASGRDHYFKKTKECIPGYTKSAPDTYQQTKDKLSVAIERAKRLHEEFLSSQPRVSFAKMNPCTTVYRLVETLKKLAQP